MGIKAIELNLGTVDSLWGLVTVYVQAEREGTFVTFYAPPVDDGIGGTATFDEVQWRDFKSKLDEVEIALRDIKSRRMR